MIIYIPLEIPVRELPGHLLLALNATARGHQVVIVSPNDIWLYFRLGLLKPGCYLLKNMNIPSVSGSMYQQFIDKGFDLYCQEQEPPILRVDFEKHLADYKITSGQMLPFKAVFCYGERDTNEYSRLFAERSTLFINSGSPRVDMWSSSFNRASITATPYLLVVSNFSYIMGNRHLTDFILAHEDMELLDSFQQEQALFDFLEEDVSICLRMLLAIKYLASTKPGFLILIRPHPNDKADYWSVLFNKHQNVRVIGNFDSISPWIAGATAVIQNGCTSALETVVQGVPVISYGPDRAHGDLGIPNQLGIRARTLQDLDQAVQMVLDGQYLSTYQTNSEKILRPLLKTGGNAAVEMVNIMEVKSQFPSEIRLTMLNLMKINIVRYSKNMLDRMRRVPMGNKYKALSIPIVMKELTGMATVMKLPMPRVRKLGRTGIVIG